LINEEVTVKI